MYDVDMQEEYYQGEIKKLVADVRLHGMGVVVIAEWSVAIFILVTCEAEILRSLVYA